jgi:predicted lipid carrier protein YhbT
MSEKDALLEKVREKVVKGVTTALKVMPVWVEAIGVGTFISQVVSTHPRFSEKLKDKAVDGKVFLFEASDIGKGFYLFIKDGEIKVLAHSSKKPDVRMKGEVKVLSDVFLGRVDPDTVFFSRRLEITGDTAAAIYLKNTLASLG